jgi:hypothetical protein
MRYLGIDPGATGAGCFLDTSGDTDTLLFGKIPPAVNSGLVVRAFRDLPPIAYIALEDVHSMGGMSAKSNFGFGRNFGMIKAVLECAKLDYVLVQPKEWQAGHNLPTTKEAGGPKGLKQAIAKRALELYPGAPLYGPRGGLLDGRADALMIAHHLRRTYENGLQPNQT